jgi:hypothetical protein
MKKPESNKLSMFEAVAAVLKAAAQKLTGYVVLNSITTEFIELIQKIKAKESEMQVSSAGKTSAKDMAKEELIKILFPLSKSLYVFGKKTNNEEIKSICSITKSDLIRFRENEFLIKAETIFNLLDTNKNSIGDYNITPEKITELKNAITSFKTAADVKDIGQTGRSSARESLFELFDRADDLLKDEMDALMEVFAEIDKDLYANYHAARVVKDLGYHSTNKKDETKPTEPQPANT